MAGGFSARRHPLASSQKEARSVKKTSRDEQANSSRLTIKFSHATYYLRASVLTLGSPLTALALTISFDECQEEECEIRNTKTLPSGAAVYCREEEASDD